MKAIKHGIIIKPTLHKELPSGIIISVKELENPMGVVVSAGGGTKKRPMHVKDGDNVVYRSNVGKALEYEGEKYLVVQQTHIIGVRDKIE